MLFWCKLEAIGISSVDHGCADMLSDFWHVYVI